VVNALITFLNSRLLFMICYVFQDVYTAMHLMIMVFVRHAIPVVRPAQTTMNIAAWNVLQIGCNNQGFPNQALNVLKSAYQDM
jgi:hypothetical protein